MKNKLYSNEFKVTIGGENYILDIRKTENTNGTPNCITYSCMSFKDNEMMTPFKRFTIVYSRSDQSYWAWTGDVIREEDRLFRETVASMLNDKVLKLVS
jgi:hypothetical protein